MPIYDWRCKTEKCEHEETTINPMSDSHKPPEEPCKKCGAKEWQKLVNFSVMRYRFHD